MATESMEPRNILLRMHPLQRMAASLLFAAIVFFFVRFHEMDSKLIAVLLWDVFALSYILMSLVVFSKRTVGQIRKLAKDQDGSRLFAFFMIVVSSFASMLTVTLLIISKDKTMKQEFIYLPATIAGMLLSWVMVHLVFTFHYAHVFYQDHKSDSSKNAGGLNFPDENKPVYNDFAYFSFVIGMTFQVSDVDITSRVFRKLALIHGLISFGLNTFVVALTINIVAGLGK